MNSYPYFIPSLASLQFAAKAPYSYERFLALADGLLEQADIDLLRSLPDVLSGTYIGVDSVVAQWMAFDTALRNELVKIRAARKHRDPSEFLRGPDTQDLSAAGLALQAWRATNMLQAEKMLDRARWEFLDESVRGHFFDRDMLFVYGMQLLIALRWDRVSSVDERALLEQSLS